MTTSARIKKYEQVIQELRDSACMFAKHCDEIRGAVRTCQTATSDVNIAKGSQKVGECMTNIMEAVAQLNTIAAGMEEEVADMKRTLTIM